MDLHNKIIKMAFQVSDAIFYLTLRGRLIVWKMIANLDQGISSRKTESSELMIE